MSYKFFNEASLGKFIELIQNKVKSMVDNANVASATNATNATKATQDSDGNAINTTYRKISDSYSKTEVDNKVANSSKSITITTDDLIKNYTYQELYNLLNSGNTIYLRLTNNDPVPFNDNRTLSVYEYGADGIVWGSQLDKSTMLNTLLVTAIDANSDGSIPLSYTMFPTNTLTVVTTARFAAEAWDTDSKTVALVVPGVTADSAVDVSPDESCFDDYVSAGIRATEQGKNRLTFSCKTIPTTFMTVNVKSVTTNAFTGTRNSK